MTRTNDQSIKADKGKACPTLLEKGCVHALEAVQATLDYGAQKYAPNSWQNVGIGNYDDAARRHRRDRDKGELRDVESGLLHLAHEIICDLFQLELFIKEQIAKDPTFDYTSFNKPPTAHKEKN